MGGRGRRLGLLVFFEMGKQYLVFLYNLQDRQMMVDMREAVARARQAIAKAVSCEMGGVSVGRQTSRSTSGASEIMILMLASCL